MNTQFLKVKDGQIAYAETGQGPLVICTPSMGDLRGEYRFLAQQLAAAGYRVVSMDVRGHGETSVQWPDYSANAVGSDILALLRHLDAGPAILIGTSMAAGAAVWVASEAPELVDGLVLIGPFVYGVEMGGLTRMLYRLLFTRPWGPAAWLKYFSTLYPSRKPDDFAAYTQTLRRNLEQPGRQEALRAMILAPKDTQAVAEQRLAHIDKPTLVLMGAKDPDFKDPQAAAQWVADRLRGQVEMIAGAGHYPHAEMPEITGPLVVDFLQSIRQTDRPAETAHAA